MECLIGTGLSSVEVVTAMKGEEGRSTWVLTNIYREILINDSCLIFLLW